MTRHNQAATSVKAASAVLLIVLTLVAGCAVGPNFRRPAAPSIDGYTRSPLTTTAVLPGVAGGEAQRFVAGQDIPGAWWTLFQSPALNALIERALAGNPTLVAAQQTLRQGIELVAAQRGSFFPTVAGSFSPAYQRVSRTLSPPLSNPDQFTYSIYTAQVTVGFTPDVFGGTRRQVEALIGQAEAQRFQREAAYVTLTSNVVGAAIQEAALRAQIAATQEIIAIASASLEIVRHQYRLGAVAGLELAAQEAALAQVQQLLPGLRKQLEQNRNLLMVLTGRLPSDDSPEHFELASLHLPTDLPLSVPSRLVQQRPDVRAAEAQMHAASAQIGVAVASRLPQLTITGAYGGMSTSFTQMFASGNPFWTVAANVAQSIFDGGTLFHRQRAAEAAFELAAAQYRSTVLTSFQNVADTLYALQADGESLQAAVAAEQASRRTLEITLKQQELGAVSYLALLSARQAYQQALITRVQVQASRFADTAALFQALGGGWWNSAATPPPAPTER
jgi:NodT family efflux transporter outer membrane factor (OMF) lipoprotein